MRPFGWVSKTSRADIGVCWECIHRRRNLSNTAATRYSMPLTSGTLKFVGLRTSIRTGTAKYSSTSRPQGSSAGIPPNPNAKRRKRSRRIVYLGGLGAIIAISSFTDTVQHGYEATKRSVRVANALMRSVRESVLPGIAIQSSPLPMLTCIAPQLPRDSQR